MLFNSFQFAIFFVLVFALYAGLGHRHQNRWLLVASYVFYGAWDWRFLVLLMGTTVADYFFARRMHAAAAASTRKGWLVCSVVMNLTVLGFFKYFNFFRDNFTALMSALGWPVSLPFLQIVLPVGISFYTFQAMSYTIDVYRGHLRPARSLEDFALFVAFFPQLVAGPIERATHLLPQIQQPRRISDYGISHGGFLVLWGLFQKVVIADNVSRLADAAFGGPVADGPGVLLGVYAFAIQIYCDFSGYSNMARGLAAMLGFRLMQNFDHPYFARNPSDFWRRWHISLSSWLRDYLYIPLGGNRGGGWCTCRNLMLTMLLGGLWHGAAWTFVIWGLLHGALLVGYKLGQEWLGSRFTNGGIFARHRTAWNALAILLFFHLVCITWLFFRAGTFAQAMHMLQALAGHWTPGFCLSHGRESLALLTYAAPLVLMELFQYRARDPYAILQLPGWLKTAIFVGLFYGIAIFGEDRAQSFIYFQF